MSDLTGVSLFAGVGGIDLAMERAGVTVTAAVEIDKSARGVLADQFPRTTLFHDVTKVTADELRATGFVPERGIVSAGWPCQGNSVAGRRGGMADPRSGLWTHVLRLLDELRPRWFLGENVPGLLSVNGGADFALVLNDLADLGYGIAYRVLDAQHFGVPQRRRRVFIVGCLGDDRRPVQVLLEPEGRTGDLAAGEQAWPSAARTAPDGIAVAGKQGGGSPRPDGSGREGATAGSVTGECRG
jgi:DNA (cytosine-5)-methyltransferase 1